MWTNLQFLADFFMCTKEILNGKLHFLWSVTHISCSLKMIRISFFPGKIWTLRKMESPFFDKFLNFTHFLWSILTTNVIKLKSKRKYCLFQQSPLDKLCMITFAIWNVQILMFNKITFQKRSKFAYLFSFL